MTKLFRSLILAILLVNLGITAVKAQCPVTIVSVTTTGNTCNGAADGSVTVTVTGGFAPYSYTLVLGAFNQSFTSNSNTFTFTGLAGAASYIVVVDADADGDATTPGGCGGAVQTGISVAEPAPIAVNVSTVAVLCSGQSTGSVTANVTGGTLPYSYSWSTVPVASTQTVNNLPAGTYTVNVTDNRGCTGTGFGTISTSSPVLPTLTVTNVSCNGGSDGAISTNVTGGTGPYSFSWNTTPVLTTQNITNLVQGSYTVNVTDVNGCQGSATAQVTQPQALSISFTSIDVTCNGFSDGSINATVTGGTPSYDYSWNSTPVQTTANATNLPAGNYVLTVTDSLGCVISDTRLITEPSPLTSTTTQVNVLCNGGNTGSATANPSGGTAPYSHLWNTSPSQSTATASNLLVGTYTDTITDDNGCILTASVTITEASLIVVTTTPTNVSCNGGNNGSAIASANGGVGPYTYSWSTTPVQNGPTAVNLTAGTYTVTVTDANLCTQTATVTIAQPTALSVTVTGQNPNCNGLCTGTAISSVTGGTPAYTYSWNTVPPLNTPNLSNLCAGAYILTVTDANGCTSTATRTVTQPQIINITTSVTNSLCAGNCTGSATANATGGNGTLTYSWNSTPVQNTATASNLCSGPYIVTVTDANGCTNTANANVNNTSNLVLTATSVQPVCNGGCNGSITTSLTGGTAPITYSWTPSSLSGTSATNLCAGTYTVTATDANGCSSSQTITLIQPPAVQVNVTVGNATCNGVCDGTVTTSVTGGLAPLAYVWTPNVSSGANASNLCAGTYQVRVTDANGCQAQTNATVSQPQPFNFNANLSSPTCDGDCNGSITTNLVGGTAPYTYSWAPLGLTTQSINNICAGTYTLSITDAANCTASQTFNLTQPSPLSVSSTSTLASCNICDGTATITPIGGTAPYTYLWSDGQTTSSVTSLCAGVNSVDITDANGCVLNTAVAVSNPPGPTNVVVSTTDASCPGSCDGTATVSASGSGTPFTYLWVGSGQTTQTATNLCAGSDFVQVLDVNGCINTTPFSISEPAVILANGTITPTGCGACTGGISLAPTGGVGPYTYSWSPNVSSGATASNLCVGAYQVTITGADGCSDVFTFNVSSPNGPTLSVSSTDPSCQGGSNGTATVTATGASTPYTFLWAPGGQSTSTATNLSAGTYSVLVTDALGCASSQTVTLTDPSSLNISLAVVNDPTCVGNCDGDASVIASGGTLPYSYSWSPGGTTGTSANNLCPGNYTATVTDANGCIQSTVITVNPATPITATVSVTNPTCGGTTNCNGSLTANIVGGTAPFTVSWNTVPVQTGLTINGLCAGTYTATITDANGCTATATGTITQPSLLNVTFTNITNLSCAGVCNGTATAVVTGGTPGYIYQWSTNPVQVGATANNLCATSYTVTVRDANNCTGTGTVTITGPNQLTANLVSQTNVSCAGVCDGQAVVAGSGGVPPYTYLWGDPAGQTNDTAVGLCAGFYAVQVRDVNGCLAIANITITQPQPLNVNITSIPSLCNGACNGQAIANAVGGSAPYTYIWSPGNIINDTLSNLCVGTYSVAVTDSQGCTVSGTAQITQPLALNVNVATTPETCNGNCDGTATANVLGGTGPYTFQWLPSGGSGNSLTNLCAGNYQLVVSDQNNCSDTISFTITSPPPIVANATVTNPTCSGLCNGSIVETVSGGVSPYTLSWNPGGSSGLNLNNLCAGLYILTITDSNGCIETDSVNVIDPSPIYVTTSSVSISCFGLCDGQAIVTIDSGGVAPFTFGWDDPNQQANDTAFSLCPGTYNVLVTDANNCTATGQVVLVQPQLLTATVTSTNGVCGDTCTGSANILALGGTTPYTYFWNNGSSTAQVTNLCAGLNYVTIQDANGCEVTNYVPIDNGNNIQISVSATDASCNGVCDGTASVVVNSPGSNFSYLWLNTGDTTSTVTGLCSGSYFVQVTDPAGCSALDQVSLGGGTFTANEQIVNTPCGVCNGSIIVNPTGGLAPYSYFWSNGGLTNSVSGLCAGLYTVTITDATNCAQTFTYSVVNTNTTISVTASSIDVTCYGGSNGSASAFVSGGSAPYTYIWSTTPQQTTQAVSGLSPGTYFVSITDANGCVASDQTTVGEPDTFIFSLPVAIDPLCANTCDGQITITAAGGILPYTFSWVPATGSSSPTASNLCAGTYTAVLTDANGCQASQSATINQPAPLVTSVTVTPSSCANSCDGTATVLVQGGVSPYTCLWLPSGSTQFTADSLCAGPQYVVVTDANGCTRSDTAIITAPPALVLTTNVNGVTCNAACNGSATVLVGGGTAPYTYSWDDFNNQTTQTAVSLCVGSYTVTVTDDNGCEDSTTVTIDDSNALQADITVTNDATCYGSCDANALAIGLGGIPPYTFQWNDDLLQTTPLASNLCAGTYIVFVFDSTGCVDADTVQLGQPTQVVVLATSTDANCGNTCDGTGLGVATGGTPPYTYQWNDNNLTANAAVANLCAGIFTVVATDGNGCNSLAQISIAQPTWVDITGSSTNSNCNNTNTGTVSISVSGGTPGYSYAWQPGGANTQNVQDLFPGDYIVTVTDANNCVYLDTFVVNANVYVYSNPGSDTTICPGDTIQFNGNGGMTYNWQPSQYIIGSNIIPDPTAYVNQTTMFYLTTTVGACVAVDSVLVTIATPDPINAGQDVTIIQGQATYLNASGATSYVWAPSTNLSDPNSALTQASPTQTTVYIVYSNDSVGCVASDTIVVTVVPGVKFPDGITPNGDGYNDTWIIDNLNLYPENSVEIFNRWGESLFYSQGYDTPWDGKFKGKDLPVGTYYYVIDLKNGQDPLTGPITIVR
ncbi:MAG: gliding motility-associated C-terminal domain-containing protein [Bacteroidia bacterium]|nr:gliding motility-associated C-terminal domain-containing protein [Bacteroidia bacterium]